MKSQQTTTPLMDEIVFEKRNKMYGAYILRKMYNKQLTRALFIASSILIAGLAYPLVSSYTNINPGRYIIFEDGSTILNKPKSFIEPPVLPKPPPSTSEIQKRVVFAPPQIVDGEVLDDGLLNQDILNQTTGNDPVTILVEPAIVKQADVIEEPDTKKETFIIAEEMPSYPGGDADRQKFLAEAINYPQQALETGIQGTVYVQFVVDSKGNITDAKIMRGIGGGCDEEALRVLKMMPPWHPGKQNGKAVRVLYTMSVSFKLQ